MLNGQKSSQNSQVDLILLGDPREHVTWDLGEVWPVEPANRVLDDRIQKLVKQSAAQACLFWDSRLGAPDKDVIQKALTRPGDVWHAGLRLGMGGLPQLLDFVAPTWMLNRDPPVDIEATSWRLTLRCCLVRLEVMRQMGGIHPEFKTLDGAALEMGHRYGRRGVLTRYLPWLLPEDLPDKISEITFEDEVRFIYYQYGRRWTNWALMRRVMTSCAFLGGAIQAWRKISTTPRPPTPRPFVHGSPAPVQDLRDKRVSILIPTLERYPYLRKLLGQLHLQTIKPHEIIIVDQTPRVAREDLAADFANSPLKIIYLDHPGQCSARNAGLSQAEGDYILFLDDDDEVSPDLIEAHLRNLKRFCADVSSGVAEDVGAETLPEDFTFIRVSDVFPTNNTLINRRVLESSGMFDMAYDKGARADADLGMRIYLSGGYMILNPEISVLHHHAPAGGLRAHKARVITYASSRKSLIQRHLPSKTEIYLAKRYFTPFQVGESLWQRVLGTFSQKGSWGRKALKFIVSSCLLPHTWWQIKSSEQEAMQMLQIYPLIPALSGSSTPGAKGKAK